MRRFSIVVMVFLIAALVLSSAPGVLAQSPVSSPGASATSAVHGIDVAGMDQSVSPAQDFWRFANGGWLDHTEIPAKLTGTSTLDEIWLETVDQQFAQLHTLVETNTLEEDSDQWKAVEFFKQGIDMDTRNAQGIAPLQPQLDAIAGITDLADMHAKMATPAFDGIPDFFNVSLTADPADSSVNTAWLAGPMLGLPDVTYYTDDSEANIAMRDAYKQIVAGFLQLAGMSETEAIPAAQAVYDFEASLAAQMVTPVESQDFAVMNNPTSLDDMQILYPALDWQAYLSNAGATVDGSSILIDSEVRLMQHLATILAATDVATIQHYLTLQLLLVAAPFLDQSARDAYFGYQQMLYGVDAQASVEEYVLVDVNGLMPDALGQLYVADYFSPEAKADVEELVANVLAAFRVRLENNTWMSPETKTAALEKLDAIRVKVGYPDTWTSYENHVIGESYWATAWNSMVATNREQMSAYGQSVDLDAWYTSPQMVEAWYGTSRNDITFPAAYLQPPVYDPEADPASNYGALGSMIGHEITHAFDLSGSQFDKDGNFVDWWTEEDRAAFDALNEEVVAQYGTIEALPGLFVDGQLTVTENVADLGGRQVAFDALQRALERDGDPGEIDGFTQNQRFFIAFAQLFRSKVREEVLRWLIQSDSHAPNDARVTIPFMNMDAFYDAFPEIRPGDAMYLPPDERVVIW